jgi:uncharacterized protein (DUF885 family)
LDNLKLPLQDQTEYTTAIYLQEIIPARSDFIRCMARRLRQKASTTEGIYSRSRAIFLLSILDTPDAAGVLRLGLADPNAGIREQADEALQHFGRAAGRVSPMRESAHTH